MLASSIFLGVFSLILIVILWFLDIKWKYRTIAHIPGPKPNFIIGNALDLGRTTYEVMQNTCKFIKLYGKYVQLWIGPNRPYLFIADVKFMEYILSSTTHIEKSNDYTFLHPWLGSGLLVSGGEKWRKCRKIITPSFHFKVLEQFIEIFNHSSDILIQKLSKHVGKESVDIYPYITLYTLDTICETAMGVPINAQLDSNCEYVNAVNNACLILVERTFSPWKQFDIPFMFSQSYQMQKKSLKILHDFTNNVIVQRNTEMEKEKAEEKLQTKVKENEVDEHEEYGLKKKMAFLDLLMRSTYDGEKLSDSEIREEVDTFMFAGHDTTASAISFILYEIAKYPEIQEKIVDELRTIFKDNKNQAVTYQDLINMKYMELVIKEGLRLYPSVPYYARHIKEDLNFDGLIIPSGTTVSLHIFMMHRDPELFPDPEKFIPERFLAETVREKSPYAYLPFSAGLRNCIGQKFAMLEMKTTLTNILRKFEVSSDPSHKLKLSAAAVLKSDSGICIKLSNREF